MKTYPLFIACILLCLSACKQDSSNKSKAKKDEVSSKYKITPFAASQAYPDAFLSKMNYKDGKFDFAVENYELGMQTPDAKSKMCANSTKGQHIHLIIDNAPYAAKYTSSFDYEIPDGEHHLLAFLSRSYHESIKTPKAHIKAKVNIKDNSIEKIEGIDQAMLFYSRPKGKYIGKANTDKVMLDFYPVNVELGDDYKVKANINGEEHILSKWQPYYIEGLPMGENVIELTLVDKNMKAVDAPLNPVKRTFTLADDTIPQN